MVMKDRSPSPETADRPFKRRRWVTSGRYYFHEFPPAVDKISGAPFRDAVTRFVSKHAKVTCAVTSQLPKLKAWRILLRVAGEEAGAGVTLFVVEEEVAVKSRRSIYCELCRVVGWSRHPVCRKRYHFIIPAEKQNDAGNLLLRGQDIIKTCTSCENMLHVSDLRCNQCHCVTADYSNEEWLYSQLDDTTHLMHGMVHSNGYGHLVRLNGREGGSRIISGGEIMSFWDRLCATLAVRMISVMDVSRKYGMEYRLLHAITFGRSWYGNWGYEFGRGSYGVTPAAYQKAVTSISSTPLSVFTFHGRKPATRLHELIAFYQSISDSRIETLKDLILFMLVLIRRRRDFSCKLKESEKLDASCITKPSSQWSMEDVKQVEEAMIKVLSAKPGGDAGWVSRRALKGAVSRTGSPELLDYCIKNLSGKAASNGLVVITRYNDDSSIELRLEQSESIMSIDQPSKEQVINDLKYVYDSLVHPQTMTSYQSQPTRELIMSSATELLNCKHFIKDYKPDKPETPSPFAIYLLCHVELTDDSKDGHPTPPPELIILPENVSVSDLKMEVTRAFQEIYAMFKKFQAEELLEFGPLEDNFSLKLLVGSRASIKLRGRLLGTHGLKEYRMERGPEDWAVDCRCGAKDDDGERMVACDFCETWHHTKCVGINDQGETPTNFVCFKCLLELDAQDESNPDDQLFCRDVVDEIRPSKKSKTCRGFVAKSKGKRNKSVFNPCFGAH